MQLSKDTLFTSTAGGIPQRDYFDLPERVLQFGTGVLLRGLPDFFIDKANKQGTFDGRIVVVKSTGNDTSDFDRQDSLYVHRICGIEKGVKVSRTAVNGSISRVLSAQSHWKEILNCATNADMQVIISNTTEVGIVLLEENIFNGVPASFPGKLLAFLFERYKAFSGAADKGMVIIPTELITDNASKLKGILSQLAVLNDLGDRFVNWMNQYNYFCNSLVDRIVPGKLTPAEKEALENELGFRDELAIISEPYCLWAIETDDQRVKDILSFSTADDGVIIAPDITIYRELKLRLLNGTHTFSCGPAVLSGFNTVKEAMDDAAFSTYMHALMHNEIIPAIKNDTLTPEVASEFTARVLDRFRNPFIEHKWLNITLQYSSKMAMRNVPVILGYVSRYKKVPERMAESFAAHILFMRCAKSADGKYTGRWNGMSYPVNDDNAAFYCGAWEENNLDSVVTVVLSQTKIWGTDLSAIDGFREKVSAHLNELKTLYENIS